MVRRRDDAIIGVKHICSHPANEARESIHILRNGEEDLVVPSMDAYERREELSRLRAKLEAAEQSRIVVTPTYTMAESRKRLDEIYRGAERV